MQVRNGVGIVGPELIPNLAAIEKSAVMSLIHSNRDASLANLRAFVANATSPDTQMPDPLSYRDVRWQISQAPRKQRLASLIEYQYFANPTGTVWGSRKHDQTCREMTLVPWPAELYLRLLLHDGAETIVARQHARSFSGTAELIAPRGSDIPVLTTRPFGPAFVEWASRIDRLANTNPPVALKTDIKTFYPSVRPFVIGKTLEPILGSECSFELRMALERIQGDSGVPGLPISAEPSAWLANQLLYQVDRVLDGIPGLESIRWSDDELLVDGVPTVVDYAQRLRIQNLRLLGLRSSSEKTVPSWRVGKTGAELLRSAIVSQGDIDVAVAHEDPQRLALHLWEEFRKPSQSTSRVNRLLRQLNLRTAERWLGELLVGRMLQEPALWANSCPRAVGFLGKYASQEQRIYMTSLASDLNGEGLVAAEQVVALIRASTSEPQQFLSVYRGCVARELVQLARQGSCIPVRMWARHGAFVLDPELVRGQTIDSGEFEALHSFEQRLVIAYADRRRHDWWLRRQFEEGSWPTTANWRLTSKR